MLRSLLTAFRQHYPQGGLVSDLVQIHDGLYLVRVSVVVEDRTLATGLAAHSSLETAEDNAFERALRHLGTAALEATAIANFNGLAAPPEAVPRPSSVVPMATGGKEPALALDPPLTETADLTMDFDLDQLDPQDRWPSSPSTPTPTAQLMEPTDAVPFSPELLNLEGIPTPSIDLSDIIAQTDVELQRLGWNVNQGREFLEKTYGKRSRHELSDEELLEFLLFLETQPTSGH